MAVDAERQDNHRVAARAQRLGDGTRMGHRQHRPAIVVVEAAAQIGVKRGDRKVDVGIALQREGMGRELAGGHAQEALVTDHDRTPIDARTSDHGETGAADAAAAGAHVDEVAAGLQPGLDTTVATATVSVAVEQRGRRRGADRTGGRKQPLGLHVVEAGGLDVDEEALAGCAIEVEPAGAASDNNGDRRRRRCKRCLQRRWCRGRLRGDNDGLRACRRVGEHEHPRRAAFSDHGTVDASAVGGQPRQPLTTDALHDEGGAGRHRHAHRTTRIDSDDRCPAIRWHRRAADRKDGPRTRRRRAHAIPAAREGLTQQATVGALAGRQCASRAHRRLTIVAKQRRNPDLTDAELLDARRTASDGHLDDPRRQRHPQVAALAGIDAVETFSAESRNGVDVAAGAELRVGGDPVHPGALDEKPQHGRAAVDVETALPGLRPTKLRRIDTHDARAHVARIDGLDLTRQRRSIDVDRQRSNREVVDGVGIDCEDQLAIGGDDPWQRGRRR